MYVILFDESMNKKLKKKNWISIFICGKGIGLHLVIFVLTFWDMQQPLICKHHLINVWNVCQKWFITTFNGWAKC